MPATAGHRKSSGHMNVPPPTELRRTLVGEFADERAVVVTPITAMFHRFRSHGWTSAGGAGWWPRLQRGQMHVVLIPQGTAVLDLVPSLLSTPTLVLVGYAGSRSPEVSVGDVARPAEARLANQPDRWPLVGGTGGTIASVPSLLAGYALDAHSDATLTDMESGYVAQALIGSPVRFSVRVLVTDRWPDEPFFRKSSDGRSLLVHQRNLVVDEVVEDLLCE